MNEISCGVCMDLMPLVKDGIAGEDSRKAVERHIASCEVCRALYGGETPPAADPERAFRKFRRQGRIFSAMLLMFGIFFGLSLTAGSGLFYNSLIMPVLGALGYLIFRWRAAYMVPLLLLVTHGVTNLLGLVRGVEHLDVGSLLMWTALYAAFSLLGTVIAGLVHYGLKKER